MTETWFSFLSCQYCNVLHYPIAHEQTQLLSKSKGERKTAFSTSQKCKEPWAAPKKCIGKVCSFRVYMQTSKMAHHTLLLPPHMERSGTHQNSAYYCVYTYIERSLHLFYLYNGLFVLYYFMHCIFIHVYIYIYISTDKF